jgi:acyl-coenzyme A thioesterase PaaI-like protein
MTGVLPFAPHLIGNPSLPALHGGLIGAFMELTAIAQLSIAEPQARLPRTVDINVDYLRSGRPVDTFARALIKRAGRRIANVQVEAWQEARSNPIAALRGHFLLTPIEG